MADRTEREIQQRMRELKAEGFPDTDRTERNIQSRQRELEAQGFPDTDRAERAVQGRMRELEAQGFPQRQDMPSGEASERRRYNKGGAVKHGSSTRVSCAPGKVIG